MKVSIITSALLFATSSLAVPFATRTYPIEARNATNTTLDTIRPTETVYPNIQTIWRSKEPGEKGGNTPNGHLLYQVENDRKIHTAVTFTLTKEQAARGTCKLVFRLSPDDWTVNQIGQTPAQFDIYRIPAECLNDDYTWDNRPPRGIHAGIITPRKQWPGHAEADFEKVDMSADKWDPVMLAAPVWSCEADKEYIFEMVPRAGANIGWKSESGSGLTIEVCG